MRQYLPYNLLLAVAIASTVFMVFYNLALRETFPVLISYEMPALPKAADPEAEPVFEEYYEEPVGESEITSVTFPLDINLATEAELMFIPQVGEVLSQRITQYREALGGYTSLEQLKEIKGVGDSMFEKLSIYLIITGEEPHDFNDAESSQSEEGFV